MELTGKGICTSSVSSANPPPTCGEVEIALRDFGWGDSGAAHDAFVMRHRPPTRLAHCEIHSSDGMARRSYAGATRPHKGEMGFL
jgi:hypothetical protein